MANKKHESPHILAYIMEIDFKRNGYFYTDTTYFMPQVMLAEGELVSFGLFPLVK